MTASTPRFKPGYSKDSRMPGVPEAGWPTPIVTVHSGYGAGKRPSTIYEGPSNFRKVSNRPFTHALVSWNPWMAEPNGEVIRLFYGEAAAHRAETLARFRDKKWAYGAAQLSPVPIYERWPKRDLITSKETDVAHLTVMLDGRKQSLVEIADRVAGYVVLTALGVDGRPIVENGRTKTEKFTGTVEFYHRR